MWTATLFMPLDAIVLQRRPHSSTCCLCLLQRCCKLRIQFSTAHDAWHLTSIVDSSCSSTCLQQQLCHVCVPASACVVQGCVAIAIHSLRKRAVYTEYAVHDACDPAHQEHCVLEKDRGPRMHSCRAAFQPSARHKNTRTDKRCATSAKGIRADKVSCIAPSCSLQHSSTVCNALPCPALQAAAS